MVGCNATLRCFGSLFFTLGNYIRHLVSTAARVDPILVAKSTRPTPYVDLMRILA